MRRYDAVFLDAQGTLLQPHPSLRGVYLEVCRAAGGCATDEEMASVLSKVWSEFKVAAGPDATYDTSEEATREWWTRFNTRVFQELGLTDGLGRFLGSLWRVFGDPSNWRLFPEVPEVLPELRARGYRMGIVSNWDSRLLPICDELGVSRYMDFIIASAPVGVEKPDPRIFRAALDRAGVTCDRTLHVGDDYEADVLGARRAGIDVVLIDRDGGPTRPGQVIRTLLELLDLLP